MFEKHKEIKDGLMSLMSENREYIDTTHNILRSIHESYINKHSDYYSANELQWINHFLDTVIYKSFLVSIAVEQLQSVKFGKIDESLWQAIDNSINKLDCSNDENILLSFALESFLFEARSFLDVYMIFICLLLKTGFTNGHMSKEKFYAELRKVHEPPFLEKAKYTQNYFKKRVFGTINQKNLAPIRDDWGSLLISLRDKIAHRDKLNLSFNSTEKISFNILLNFPSINDLTYQLFAETLRNGIHALFYDVLAHIYEEKWDDFQKQINK